METRELTDMTAVLRSINDGNPSNAERWVTLTQRVVRAETRANAAERAAARKDWEKQNAEYDTAGSPTTAPRLPSRKPPKRRTKPPAGKCLP